eukprot:288700_1
MQSITKFNLNVVTDDIEDNIDVNRLPISPIAPLIKDYHHRKSRKKILPPISWTRLAHSKSFDSIYAYSHNKNANNNTTSHRFSLPSRNINRNCAIHNASASTSTNSWPISLSNLPSINVASQNISSHSRSLSTSTTSSHSRTSLHSLFSNIKTKIHHKTNKPHHNSVPNIKLLKSKWRPTLTFIYNDAELLDNLIEFMTGQYNEENILFLQDVHILQRNITDLLLLKSEINIVENEKINVEITDIYNKFIKTNSDKQINLSSDCFKNIMYIYQRFSNYNINEKLNMFNVCINEIEHLMQTSILSSFYISELFQTIARERYIFTNENIQNKQQEYAETDNEKQNDCTNDFFDHISETYNNKYIISSKGYNKGSVEWKIKIIKCNKKKQEFGVVSHFDTKIEMSEGGIGETALFGSRAIYGYNHLNNSFYYASYNKNNTLRCNKDLTQLKVHQNGIWRHGDIIKIVLNSDKGNIKFYLNEKQVRKSVSIQPNTTYYPIISFSGNCRYIVI